MIISLKQPSVCHSILFRKTKQHSHIKYVCRHACLVEVVFLFFVSVFHIFKEEFLIDLFSIWGLSKSSN